MLASFFHHPGQLRLLDEEKHSLRKYLLEFIRLGITIDSWTMTMAIGNEREFIIL